MALYKCLTYLLTYFASLCHLTEGRIAGGRIFHGGQCSVASSSLQYCSRLQQSRFHAYIADWMIRLLHRLHRCRLAVDYNGPDNPQSCPFQWGSRLPSNAWFLGSTWVSLQTASRSVQPFFVQHIRVTNKQTDPRHATSVAMGRLSM